LPATHSGPRPGGDGESGRVMRAFEYVSARNTDQAVSLLPATWGGTEILAGGTDLLALMKDGVVSPRRIVNIKDISELRGVSSTVQGMRIGALTTLADLAGDAEVRKNYPALAEALIEVASPQIRNQATLGGNLCQRPQCWYFRNGFGLLPKDENGKELVTGGENRYHAILGNGGPAKFVSPSTIVPILIAYGAKVRLHGPKGRRELELEKFFVIPKADGEREHDLRPNEIVTEVLLPPAGEIRAAHYEVRQKEAFDWPLAVAAVALRMRGATVLSARVVMGHVAPAPWPSPEAESVLVGNAVDPEIAQKAAEAAVKGATPLSGNGYKIQLARVAVKRAILKAASGTIS
jgi:xanthine dehydrogenase YagS FAD-binding subunit